MNDKSYWSDFWQRRLSRRGVLRGAAVGGAGLAAAAVVGCAEEKAPSGAPSADRPGTAPAGETVKRGGTLRLAVSAWAHLDLMTTAIVWIWAPAGPAHNKLLRLTPLKREIEPDLAKLEQPEQLSFVFKIPQGVKFHNKAPVNGRELTARDIIFSIDRLRSREAIFVHNADYRAIDKMEATDNYTLRITTKFPDASLLSTLASAQSIIIAPETIERFNDLRRGEAQVGTGPFILEKWDRTVGGKLVRNPDYFKKDLPYLDEVAISVVDVPPAWNLFLAGQLDTARVPPEEFGTFDPKKEGIISAPASFCGSASLEWDWNLQRKPYDDVRVRRALSLLIDRRQALENGYPTNLGKELLGVKLARVSVAISHDQERFNLSIEDTEKLGWGWNPAKKQDDIREAIRLLEASGITRDKPLKMEVVGDANPGAVHGRITGEFMKGYIEKVSEKRVQLDPLNYIPAAQWVDRTAEGKFDSEFAHRCVGWDVDHPLSKLHASDGGRNYGRWKDPQMDRLLEKERSTFEFNQRRAAVHEALRYIADQVPIAWIGYGASPEVAKKAVRNYLPGQGPDQFEITWIAG